MPKTKNPEEWITVKEAALILSENSRRAVTENYVRRLGAAGTFETWEIDGRTKLYNKEQVLHYFVRPRGTGEVRRRVRKDAREKAAAQEQANKNKEEAIV